jgi:ERCC4-type nuclease
MPERYGADFLMFSPHMGKIGVQRKEIKDLVASINDGRLAKEVQQLQSCDIAHIIIEGRVEWTNEGLLLTSTHSQFTKAQYLGTLWSLQASGLGTGFTTSKTDTMSYLSTFEKWTCKDHHTSLARRPSQPKSMFGETGTRDTQRWILQGFTGISYGRAEAILDHCGSIPLQWTIDLEQIAGIGPKTAKRLEAILHEDKT